MTEQIPSESPGPHQLHFLCVATMNHFSMSSTASHAIDQPHTHTIFNILDASIGNGSMLICHPIRTMGEDGRFFFSRFFFSVVLQYTCIDPSLRPGNSCENCLTTSDQARFCLSLSFIKRRSSSTDHDSPFLEEVCCASITCVFKLV